MAEYIEREALVHHFMTTRQYLTKDLVMDAAYEVSKFPAADVVPVVHGAWKPYRDYFSKRHIGWLCTNCSGVQMDLSNGDTNYCPNCGAMMGGE